jgi:hypothetical protein
VGIGVVDITRLAGDGLRTRGAAIHTPIPPNPLAYKS